MKSRRLSTALLSFPLASAIAALLSGQSAQAANFWFDQNGTATGFGVANLGSYNWNGTNFWNATSAGTGAVSTWAATNAAFFVGAGAATSYTITLGASDNATISLGNFALNSDGTSGTTPIGTGDVVIGAVGSTGTLALSAANSIGSYNGTLTINSKYDLGANRNTNFRGGTVIINGVISGTGTSGVVLASGAFGLTSGTLTLAGNNTFVGNTSVASGYTLVMQHANALGASGGTNTVASGGALELANGIVSNSGEAVTINGTSTSAFGALRAGAGGGTWSGQVTLGDASARLGATAGNTLTVTGSIIDGVGTALGISGASGTGAVILNPTTSNTYTGATSIVRGILRLGKNNALPTGTTLDVDAASGVTDASTFDLASFSQTVAALQDTATTSINGKITNSVAASNSILTVNQAVNTAYDGIIENGSGSVALTKGGVGSLTLNGANTYGGGTILNQGTITVGAAGTLGANSGALSVNNTNTAAGTAAALNLSTGLDTTVGSLSGTIATPSSGTNTATINTQTGRSFTVNQTAAGTYAGVIAGAGSFTLGSLSTNTLTLTGTNTYTGGTILNQGTITVGAAGTLGASTGALSVNNTNTAAGTAATLNLSTGLDTTAGSLSGTVATPSSGTNTATINTQTGRNFTVNQTAAGTYAGVIAGAGSFTLGSSSTNTLTLTGANTYTSATSISAGTLTISGSGSINTSSGITVNGSGAKLLQTSSVAASPSLTLTQGTLTGSGTANTVNVGAGTGGIISNNNGVSGAALTIGNLTLAGAANINLFSNTTAADLIVTGTLTTGATAATLTANNLGGWINGSTYTMLTFGGGSIAGSGDNFTKAVNNLSARQAPTWTTTSSAITLGIAGDNPYWVGDTDGQWNTATINNWRLVTGGGYTTFLATDDVLFNNNATGTRAIDITENVAPNSVVIDNNTSNPYTIGSVGGFGITSGTLTKNGLGTATISSNNSFSGTTTLNNGVLRATTSANALGSGTLALTGGELQLANDTALNFARNTTVSGNAQITSDTLTAVAGLTQTLGTLSIGANTLTIAKGANATGNTAGVAFGAITFTAAPTFSIGANSTLTLGAVSNGANTATITGAGNLAQSGVWGGGAGGLTLDAGFTGLVTLSQANTYTGNTLISGGTLQIGNGGTTGSLSSSSSITNDGTLAFNRTNTVTQGTDFASIIGGSGGVTQSGSGTLVLTGANTYSTTLISAGTVQVGSGGTTGSLGSGAVTNNGALVFNRSDSYTVSNAIGGSGSLTKQGAGVLTLSVANGYTGATSITARALIVSTNGGLGTNAAGTTITSGASLGLSGGIDYSTTELISGSGSGLATATGPITSVQRGLIQSVTGSNTFRGNIELTANVISRIGNQDGSSLTLTGSITQASGITTAGILFRTGLGGDWVTLSNSGNSFGVNSQIFAGATVAGNYGGVRLGATNALPTNLTISSSTGTGAGSAVDLAGFDQGLNGLIAGGGVLSIINSNTTTASTLTLNPTVNRSQFSSATNNTLVLGGGGLGVISVVKDGTFTQTLSGTNTYTGGTILNQGTLTLGATGTLGATTGSLAVNNNNSTAAGTAAILNLATGADTTVGSLSGTIATPTSGSNTATINTQTGRNFTVNQTGAGTYAGVIAGAGGFTLGSGSTSTLTLTGTNTYTGTTTVSAGALAVNGSLANTTTTVASGGRLQGSGSIGGSVTVQSGGTIAAGNSIESLATGALTLNGGSTFAYEINNDAAAGVAGDLTAVTGDLTLDLTTAAILTLSDLGSGVWSIGDKLSLISYTGTWNNGLFTYGSTLADDSNFMFSGMEWTFNYNDSSAGTNYTGDLTGSSFVTMTAIPEPNIAALFGGFGVLALLRRRRP